ncbi:MAG: RNA polymerase-binding protein DksA [Holosporales bacterium]|jgi:DnaK suppressor protein|nr:RNA polymerase-binding protein DksA [Holosporales bacterium]
MPQLKTVEENNTLEEDISKIVVPNDYKPSNQERFMCSMQRAYFRKKLLEWKKQLYDEFQETLKQMPGTLVAADSIDVASNVVSQSIELRARDRERKLIHKIDEALQRIEDGTYGYCEETGEPISLRRLEARPIATLSIEAQERHERKEEEYSEEVL